MKLVCNTLYRIGVIIRRETRWLEYGRRYTKAERQVAYVEANYCGGSCVDDEGHEIGGGCWAIGDKQYWDLNVVSIEELPYRAWDDYFSRRCILNHIRLEQRAKDLDALYRKWQTKTEPCKNKNAEAFWSKFQCTHPLKCDECGSEVRRAACACSDTGGVAAMYSEWSY